ncbi:MAG: response regulator transcription factor [Anaerolineae bacterium]|nr:response regulator transcription factor [Anaerolineae bacterium]
MAKGHYTVLVVDDEPKYVRAIRLNLEASGYQVITAGDGQSAIELAAAEEPHLIILDIKMPGLDGFTACARIREFSTAPIIMLTALAGEADKVKGLELGADDYLTKPFSAQELLARVKAALRRVELAEQKNAPPVSHIGELTIDFARQRVFIRGLEVSLTPTEYRLLYELSRQPGRVLTQEYLLERVWGPGYEGDTSLLWQAIHRVRQKIERDPRHPEYIHTRPGLGYVLEFSPE